MHGEFEINRLLVYYVRSTWELGLESENGGFRFQQVSLLRHVRNINAIEIISSQARVDTSGACDDQSALLQCQFFSMTIHTVHRTNMLYVLLCSCVIPFSFF